MLRVQIGTTITAHSVGLSSWRRQCRTLYTPAMRRWIGTIGFANRVSTTFGSDSLGLLCRDTASTQPTVRSILLA